MVNTNQGLIRKLLAKSFLLSFYALARGGIR
ncbi:hypothetical protein MCEMSE6_01021 [Oxalobacteraceae bacterium]